MPGVPYQFGGCSFPVWPADSKFVALVDSGGGGLGGAAPGPPVGAILWPDETPVKWPDGTDTISPNED